MNGTCIPDRREEVSAKARIDPIGQVASTSILPGSGETRLAWSLLYVTMSRAVLLNLTKAVHTPSWKNTLYVSS